MTTTNQPATTNSNSNRAWAIAQAKLAIELRSDAARDAIREKIAWCRRNLDEAERRLDAGETPNTCGVLQGSAVELDMAVARLAAIRDLA
ncbi:MAG: hypothetical protein KIS87_08660, partial [Phycisphaeraceae bacterium]|nr:hypothetical protein [Phycisphaeraceae bacterium]